jgi:mRNA interferase RelE/StbE
MTWKIEFSEVADKDLAKFDKPIRKRILTWLDERLTDCENPRLWGKSLTGSHGDKWRYRIGDYRVLCLIKDNVVTVEVVSIGHRKNVYE